MTTFDLNKPYCKYFNEICQIPHGSFDEGRISNYLVKFGEDRGLKTIRDDELNVIIYKDASKGYENSAPLLLQAHMDMVCEKNKDSNHDFSKDPLDLYVDGDWLKAKGTTLGADDGMGVAYILAILDDDTLPHPALECCFTTKEEVGLLGALKLDTSLFKARRMVSLDGGGEVSTGISSAGGCVVTQSIPLEYKNNSDPTYRLFLSGLLGGHSGGEIHKEKGNSNKLAFRIIKEMLLKNLDFKFISADGGLKDNAIPRECEITFASSSSFEELNDSMLKSLENFKKELEFSDKGVSATLSKVETSNVTLDSVDSSRIVDYIFLLPNGFKHRSMAIEGLTLTSLNLGIVKTEGNHLVLTSSLRSALECGIDHMIDEIRTLANLFGYKVSTSARYPGWNYKANSDMRKKLNKVMVSIYNKPLVEVATHGGCECGVFAAISDDMDILTYGAICEDIHTPLERLDLNSFDRGYKVLTSLLEECK